MTAQEIQLQIDLLESLESQLASFLSRSDLNGWPEISQNILKFKQRTLALESQLKLDLDALQ